ncbi:hypothetical protein D9M69_592480 [compost metagenome]
MAIEQSSDSRQCFVLPAKVPRGLLDQSKQLVGDSISGCRQRCLELQPVVLAYQDVLLNQVLHRLEQFRARTPLCIEGVEDFPGQLQTPRFQILELLRKLLDLLDPGFQSDLGLRLGD